ncbi:hypothetical protein DA68_20905 [Bacillus cereus]|nr:hypothetical protein DA68_20905 [Bacillus cereus]
MKKAPCCAGRFFVLRICLGLGEDTRVGVQLNISAIFQIYRPYLGIYQRLFQYIDDSTRDIDLSTNYDIARGTNTPHPSNRKGAFIYKEGDWK